jgi:hypothetical protein
MKISWELGMLVVAGIVGCQNTQSYRPTYVPPPVYLPSGNLPVIIPGGAAQTAEPPQIVPTNPPSAPAPILNAPRSVPNEVPRTSSQGFEKLQPKVEFKPQLTA